MSAKKLLIAAVFVIFLIRLVILLKSSYTFYSDDAIYASIARMWIKGDFSRVFHPTWPPLFPALSAFLYLITNNFEIALRLVSLIAGVLLIIPAFYLMRRTISTFHAFAFAFSLIFIYPLLLMSLLPLSDSLAVVLTISGITSFFIAFLAIIIMLVRYISSYNYEHILYYSINSFINAENISPNSYFGYLPLKKRIDFNHFVKPEIKYLLFVMIKLKDQRKISKEIKQHLPKDYKYYLIDLSTMVTVIPAKDLNLNDINTIKENVNDCIVTYSFIDRSHWHNIEISYLFKSLLNILKNMKQPADIVEIKEDVIF